MYSIGALSKLSKLSVRTLRYYDEIGLLKPSKLSEGGHRYYKEKDVELLHNIITLKELGFELETIKSILLNQSKSSKELLEMRLEMIHQQQEQLKIKERKIKGLLQLIDLEAKFDWEAIFQTFTKYNKTYKESEHYLRKLFTKEEMRIIEQLPKIGDENELNARFIELIKETRNLMNKKTDSKEAQELAYQFIQLADQMYQGNWKLYNKLVSLDNEMKEKIGFYQLEPNLIQYLDTIIRMYIKKNEEGIPNEKNSTI